jgi:hypothetical protein
MIGDRGDRRTALGRHVRWAAFVLVLFSAGGCVTAKLDANRAVPKHAYSFFVAGHAYGVPGTDNPGVHPPFRSAFSAIRERGAEFGILTGDIVWNATAKDWEDVDRDLQSLGMPVHFAVGNHDMNDRALFASRYGPTYYSFRRNEDLFIILDGELDPCRISGEQRVFLTDTLRGSDARYVFVFVHRLLWVVEGTPYLVLQGKMNTTEGYDFHGNFWSEVVPALRALDVPVYVFAGDVGVPWAQSLFYERDGNIHLVASGMGGSEEESYLTVGVGPEEVVIEARRLDGQPLQRQDITAYGLGYYRGL